MCAALVHVRSDSSFTTEELNICNLCIPRNLSNSSKSSSSMGSRSASFSSIADLSKLLKQSNHRSESLGNMTQQFPCTSRLSTTCVPTRRSSISSLSEALPCTEDDDEVPSFNVILPKNPLNYELDLEILSPALFPILKHPDRSTLHAAIVHASQTEQHDDGMPATRTAKSVKFSSDLNHVKRFVSTEGEPPRIPTSALSRLNLQTDKKYFALRGLKYFAANFVNPITRKDFMKRLRNQQVLLESAMIEKSLLMGTISVINRTYEKSVIVRCSFNHWATFMDFSASYIIQSSNGSTDRFCFSIVLPVNLVVGDHVQFAIRYTAGIQGEHGVFWDNNLKRNYAFECFAKTAAIQGDDFWMHFL